MNRLITAILLVSTVGAALPASAGTIKYKFKDGPIAGQTLEYKQWPQHKCDTYLGNTRFKNMKMIESCIGRVSKKEYAKMYQNFLVDYEDATDLRVKGNRVLGAKALVHPDVKWKSDKRQKTLKDGKLAATILGALAGATTLATGAFLTGGGSVFLGLWMMPG